VIGSAARDKAVPKYKAERDEAEISTLALFLSSSFDLVSTTLVNQFGSIIFPPTQRLEIQ
jgi:hypothetical protein